MASTCKEKAPTHILELDDLKFYHNINRVTTCHWKIFSPSQGILCGMTKQHVTEWISLELNIYISILFLSFEIDLAFI